LTGAVKKNFNPHYWHLQQTLILHKKQRCNWWS